MNQYPESPQSVDSLEPSPKRQRAALVHIDEFTTEEMKKAANEILHTLSRAKPVYMRVSDIEYMRCCGSVCSHGRRGYLARQNLKDESMIVTKDFDPMHVTWCELSDGKTNCVLAEPIRDHRVKQYVSRVMYKHCPLVKYKYEKDTSEPSILHVTCVKCEGLVALLVKRDASLGPNLNEFFHVFEKKHSCRIL